MSRKIPAVARVMQEGIFQNEKDAESAFLAGNIWLDGVRLKRGTPVSPDAVITVRGQETEYAGKGGYKLQGALEDFHLTPEGKICLDAGASTGGFTDCLLRRGAACVYAVDVGFGQLSGRLRQDPKVVNLEKTNISDEKLRSLDPVPTFATADLSYLSLADAVPVYRQIMRDGGDLICLVKPLFEIDDAEARRSGVIRDDQYLPMLLALFEKLNAIPGARCTQVTHSHITGNAGTKEFFVHVLFDDGPRETMSLENEAQRAVMSALRLEKYKKL